VGNVLRFARDPLRYLEAVRDAYHDPLVRLSSPNGDIYLVLSPELVRRVLVEEDAWRPRRHDAVAGSAGNPRYVKADFRPDLTGPFLGEGLLTAEGRSWADQRRRLNPAFYASVLRGYVDSIHEHTARIAADWRAEPGRDLHADMTDVTVRVIAETLLGTEFDDADVATVAEAMDGLADSFGPSVSRAVLPSWLPRSRPARFDHAIEALDTLADRVVEAHRVPDPPADIVTTLLDAVDAGAIDERRVRDEVVTFLLAGHETTALVLTYAWFLLSGGGGHDRPVDAGGTDGKPIDRLQAEIDALDGVPGWDDRESLPYTGAVLNESMRLYPPVWAVFREPRGDARLGDYRVPAGTPMVLPQWAIHRDGRHFEDPLGFRPSRWLERTPAGTPAFFPFGAGPRVCIGKSFALLEATLVLATLAREFEVTVDAAELPLDVGITMRPEGPVEGRVVPRSR
jgi:cytochrome P450